MKPPRVKESLNWAISYLRQAFVLMLPSGRDSDDESDKRVPPPPIFDNLRE
jgi:hypothetical protein